MVSVAGPALCVNVVLYVMNCVGLRVFFLQKRSSNRSRYLGPRTTQRPTLWVRDSFRDKTRGDDVCIYKAILGKFLNKSFTEGLWLCVYIVHPWAQDVRKK